MENKPLTIFTLLGLIGLVLGEDELESLIENLRTSRSEAERGLTKEQLKDIASIRSQIEKYEQEKELLLEKFEEHVSEPCKAINKAYSDALSEYYYKVEETPDLGEKLKSSAKQEYEWLMHADDCHNVMKDIEMAQDKSSMFERRLVEWLDDIESRGSNTPVF